jgi:hypothetical protein
MAAVERGAKFLVLETATQNDLHHLVSVCHLQTVPEGGFISDPVAQYGPDNVPNTIFTRRWIKDLCHIQSCHERLSR